ncbi:histidine ammonia-lyase [Picrophilus oshimae]|uniref:Histidine ammonia-lyase n=1 Tax=Picrophilus torridus (strain ATCC 700027 / DSM 9790 / JCM 10055 / NBRC 100828 / KAW 2/3) TaxID=1122961 RepID=A0A8G2FXU9_PICTO|nr:histidine ammonia-lyase [Picrophilus oshimae]SMD31479.1 histidine ammonia-lyase [Picrophilus oshimae DSM 9789]
MIILSGDDLNVNKLYRISVLKEKIEISESAKNNVLRSRKSLEKIISSGNEIYGVTTGFGSLLNRHVDEKLELQKNLIRSHSSGTGKYLKPEYVRAVMSVRLNSLLKGFSGVSIDLIDRLIFMLNNDIIPIVPEYGSVGASGDLAPLAHIGLAIMGEGPVLYKNDVRDSNEVFRIFNIEKYEFKEKEGVALINGTSMITGILGIELYRSMNLIKHALISSMMAFEALSGTDKAYREWAIASRPHNGQITIADNLRFILKDSEIVKNANKIKIQDAYTLRCIPQVYGAVLDAIKYSINVANTEMNSATDNPLVYNDDYISTGNFHGEPVALAADFSAIALTDLGNMIERRIARLVDTNLSGLPPFLVNNYGINSGYMIPQYTAAALCNMNKILSHPASADSIPTSANQEDHVSMGANSALKLIKIRENIESIIAIEYLIAAQALEFKKYNTSNFIDMVYKKIRSRIDQLENDRPPYIDIEKILEMMNNDLMEFINSIRI